MWRLAVRSFLVLGALITASPASAQQSGDAESDASNAAIKAAKKAGLVVKYDKFDGTTTVFTDLWETSLGFQVEKGMLKAGAGYTVAGKDVRNRTPIVTLVFQWLGPRWQFQDADDLTFLLDDSTRIHVTTKGRKAEVRRTPSGVVVETITAEISDSAFFTIAAAKKVEGKLGTRQFRFKGINHDTFRHLAAVLR
jgi:hypothetical protein